MKNIIITAIAMAFVGCSAQDLSSQSALYSINEGSERVKKIRNIVKSLEGTKSSFELEALLKEFIAHVGELKEADSEGMHSIQYGDIPERLMRVLIERRLSELGPKAYSSIGGRYAYNHAVDVIYLNTKVLSIKDLLDRNIAIDSIVLMDPSSAIDVLTNVINDTFLLEKSKYVKWPTYNKDIPELLKHVYSQNALLAMPRINDPKATDIAYKVLKHKNADKHLKSAASGLLIDSGYRPASAEIVLELRYKLKHLRENPTAILQYETYAEQAYRNGTPLSNATIVMMTQSLNHFFQYYIDQKDSPERDFAIETIPSTIEKILAIQRGEID